MAAKTKGSATTMFPAAGQVVSIRVYASRRVGKPKKNVIKFEIYDEATQQCGRNTSAYARSSLACELHRHHAYRMQMNDNPRRLQVLETLEEIPLPTKPKKPASAKVVSAFTLLQGSYGFKAVELLSRGRKGRCYQRGLETGAKPLMLARKLLK